MKNKRSNLSLSSIVVNVKLSIISAGLGVSPTRPWTWATPPRGKGATNGKKRKKMKLIVYI